jgi:hypothetical protein
MYLGYFSTYLKKSPKENNSPTGKKSPNFGHPVLPPVTKVSRTKYYILNCKSNWSLFRCSSFLVYIFRHSGNKSCRYFIIRHFVAVLFFYNMSLAFYM